MPESLTQDEEHLRLLAIFHFVVAGMVFLVSLIPVIHLLVFVAIVSETFEPSDGNKFPRLFSWFFILFSGGWIVFGSTFAVSLVIAGRALQARRRYTFCLVMACISCMFMPFGTVLGVFTIIVLVRYSVKQMFDGSSPTAGEGHIPSA